jgi:hypothetical protein
MRKFVGLLAVTGLSMLSLAGVASASSNLPNGSVLDGTGTNVDLSGIITCHSTVRGTLFNKPAGQGVHGVLHTVDFGPCAQSGNSAVSTVPAAGWTLDVSGSTNGGATWDGTVTGVNVDIAVFGGLVRCNYTGNVNALYENPTMVLTLSGTLASSSGGLCPATGTVSGSYHITPTLTIS